MLKEIHEQPTALRQTIRGRVDAREGSVELEDFPQGAFEDVDRVQLIACGTSYHAALYAVELLGNRGVPAEAFLASEYTARAPPTDGSTLAVGVTQSGETADTLNALEMASERGHRTVAVTNVVGSTAARTCDDSLFIRAGPEIGVAATKTFSSQIVTLGCLAERIASDSVGHTPDPAFLAALEELPGMVETVVEESTAEPVAIAYGGSDSYFFVGRNEARPVALEGALKLKEISYEHAEGFAAGELKHGPLALVTERTPVFAIATGSNEERMVSTTEEVQARNGPVICAAPRGSALAELADHTLSIPATHHELAGVLANVQLQLFAYHTASLLERSIDKPRNLAKSVTVE
jgi:glucosamine--fructose-6-phosphate aminotransferase (isomerizing)